MNGDVFKFLACYELVLSWDTVIRPVRIEIFASLTDESSYRARVWVQNTYNLYPTFLNIDEKGQDTRSIHSSDEINMEITSLIAEEPDFLTGRHYDSADEFLAYVKNRVLEYQRTLGSTDTN